MSDEGREHLRHTLATLAYRGGKALRGVPDGVSRLKVAEGSRTPLEILAHVNDLLDWALALCRGEHVCRRRQGFPRRDEEAPGPVLARAEPRLGPPDGGDASGGGKLGVYEPRHARPKPLGGKAKTEAGAAHR